MAATWWRSDCFVDSKSVSRIFYRHEIANFFTLQVANRRSKHCFQVLRAVRSERAIAYGYKLFNCTHRNERLRYINQRNSIPAS